MLFLVYINELVQILEEHRKVTLKVKLFADNVKMYVKLLDNYDLENFKLFLVLDLLVKWAETWQLLGLLFRLERAVFLTLEVLKIMHTCTLVMMFYQL